MKILLLGEASNYHNCLGAALRKLGHDVTVASNGGKVMRFGKDIDLSRGPGKLRGAWLWMKLRTVLAPRLKGYDVVQLGGPIFVDQKPARVQKLLDWLRKHNRHVFLSDFIVNTPYVRYSLDHKHSKLRYSDYLVGDKPSPFAIDRPDKLRAWTSAPLAPYCDYLYSHIDGAVTALYEYHLSTELLLPPHRIAYAGIPIDVDSIDFTPLPPLDKVRFLAGWHNNRASEKGTDLLIGLVRRLQEKYPDKVELEVVHDLPYEVWLQKIRDSHVVLDQIYSYTPATTALLAMAMGRVAVTGGEEQYYDFIDEPELRPAINPDPADMEATYRLLEDIVLHPEQLAVKARQGRQLVEKHNRDVVVAQKFVDFWHRFML